MKVPLTEYKQEILIANLEKFKSKHLNEFFLVSSGLDLSQLEEIVQPKSDQTIVGGPVDIKYHIIDLDSQVYSFKLAGTTPWAMVGRRKGCQVIIDSESVSRDHAKIFIGPDGQVYILDAESKNGTFVNGQKLKAYDKELLQDKYFVSFGSHLFRFHYLDSFYAAVENFFKPKRRF